MTNYRLYLGKEEIVVEAARLNFEASGHISLWAEDGRLIVAERYDAVEQLR